MSGGPSRRGDESSRDALLAAKAMAEEKLTRLALEKAAAEEELSTLRHRLETLDSASRPTAMEGAPALDQAGKVRLFLERFRGRRDVYPTRFVRKRDGQPGYAPDCRNKFVRGVCPLPEVKCGACSHQGTSSGNDEGAPVKKRPKAQNTT